MVGGARPLRWRSVLVVFLISPRPLHALKQIKIFFILHKFDTILISAIAVCLKYVVKGLGATKKQYGSDCPSAEVTSVLAYLQAVDTVKHSNDAQAASRLVEQFQLSREHIPTHFANSKEVPVHTFFPFYLEIPSCKVRCWTPVAVCENTNCSQAELWGENWFTQMDFNVLMAVLFSSVWHSVRSASAQDILCTMHQKKLRPDSPLFLCISVVLLNVANVKHLSKYGSTLSAKFLLDDSCSVS